METSGAKSARTIKEWPEGDRPREKMHAKGSAALNASELLAVLLRTGESRGRTALDIGRELWQRFDESWERLLNASPAELAATPGVGPAKAASVAAALEIARRLAETPLSKRAKVDSARDVFEHFRGRLAGETRERFFVLLLDAKGRLLREEEVSVGTLTESFAHPREAFKTAVRESAAAVLFVHNHPSGDPSPSREDVESTNRLLDAAKVLDIKIVDHVIVGSSGYYSFIESAPGKRASGKGIDGK